MGRRFDPDRAHDLQLGSLPLLKPQEGGLDVALIERQHLPPFGVLLGRGVKTLAHLKAGNQSVTS